MSNLLSYVPHFGITLVIFFVVDLVWLGLVAREFYNKHIGFLRAEQTNWAAALAFYLIFSVGLLYFAIIPGWQARELGTTALNAAVYGFLTYATYDLTNLATLKNWPTGMSLVDIAWGTLLSAAVGTLSFFTYGWLLA